MNATYLNESIAINIDFEGAKDALAEMAAEKAFQDTQRFVGWVYACARWAISLGAQSRQKCDEAVEAAKGGAASAVQCVGRKGYRWASRTVVEPVTSKYLQLEAMLGRLLSPLGEFLWSDIEMMPLALSPVVVDYESVE